MLVSGAGSPLTDDEEEEVEVVEFERSLGWMEVTEG